MTSLLLRSSVSFSSLKLLSFLKSYQTSSLNSFHSCSVQIFLRTSCILRRSSKSVENLFLSLLTNLENFSSSLVISVVLPRENPCEGSSLEIGTPRALYSFFSKYLTSSISPRFCPPGSVVISVPLEPSRLGNQKSSSIERCLRSSLISPVDESYTSLFLYLTIISLRYCSALIVGILPTST